MPRFDLLQHVYTSGKREFETVAACEDISKEEQLRLESKSLYVLPASLMYAENPAAPHKYIFYQLNEKRCVVGRAVYIGKDGLGRPGNYLFHNLIINSSDFEKLYNNPLALIKHIKKEAGFIDSIPQDPALPPLSVDMTIPDTNSYQNFSNDNRLIHALWEVVQHSENIKKPVLILGNENDILEVAEWIIAALAPVELRTKISFDSYSYNVNTNSTIVALPSLNEYRQSIAFSIKIKPQNREFSINIEPAQPAPMTLLVLKKLSSDKINDVIKLHRIRHDACRQGFHAAKNMFLNSPEDIRSFFYSEYRKSILNHIIQKIDMDVLSGVKKFIDRKDFEFLSRDLQIVKQCMQFDLKKLNAMIASWFLKLQNKNQILPLFVNAPSVLEILLDRIDFSSENTEWIYRMFALLPDRYDPEIERLFLKVVLPQVGNLQSDKKLNSIMIDIFNKLPETNDKEIIFMRNYILGNISVDSSFLDAFKADYRSTLGYDVKKGILSGNISMLVHSEMGKETIPFLIELFSNTETKKERLDDILKYLKDSKTKNRNPKEVKKHLLKNVFLFKENEIPRPKTKKDRSSGRKPKPVVKQTKKRNFFSRLFGNK